MESVAHVGGYVCRPPACVWTRAGNAFKNLSRDLSVQYHSVSLFGCLAVGAFPSLGLSTVVVTTAHAKAITWHGKDTLGKTTGVTMCFIV